MNKANVTILREDIEKHFLPLVRMPGRYIGGEVNQIAKDLSQTQLRVALCFPDTYEIGMSNTGLAIIYHVINSLDFACAERVFTPWIDAVEIMRKKRLPLYTLESFAKVSDFDILGFSLSTELCPTNILLTLELAGIPLRSEQRKESDPLIVAGGQLSNCAEPIADFIDIFILGEGEEIAVELLERLRWHKQNDSTRAETLLDIAKRFDWAYVPSLYEFEYDGDKIKSFTPKHAGLRTEFKNAVVKDFDNAKVPQKPIVPFTEAIHERVSIEVMRGCPGSCRFCQASYCRRPLRYRSVDNIVETAIRNYEATAFDTVSLLSLSTSDYPWLGELIDKLNKYFKPRNVGISLPSLRVDKQLELVPKMATSVRKSGLTIAVESASESLRVMMNKPVTNENLFKAIRAAYEAGFQRVKLYFMAGFPGETLEDIRAIVDLAYDVAKLRKEVTGHLASVTAAVSWLIPKPHTPMGWYGQRSQEYFLEVKKTILSRKRELKAKCVKFNFHNLEQSLLETVIARGDRRLGKVIEDAYLAGAKFDLWNETFNFEIWQKAFADNGLDMNELAQRSYRLDEILPWQHLGGPDREYLIRHYNKAQEILSSLEK